MRASNLNYKKFAALMALTTTLAGCQKTEKKAPVVEEKPKESAEIELTTPRRNASFSGSQAEDVPTKTDQTSSTATSQSTTTSTSATVATAEATPSGPPEKAGTHFEFRDRKGETPATGDVGFASKNEIRVFLNITEGPNIVPETSGTVTLVGQSIPPLELKPSSTARYLTAKVPAMVDLPVKLTLSLNSETFGPIGFETNITAITPSRDE